MTLRISYELNNALKYRQRNRIFGNIDNNIVQLSNVEIFHEEFEKVFTKEKIKNLFDRDSLFFKHIK